MSKNSPERHQPDRQKLSPSFRLKPSIQNGVFLLSRKNRTQSDFQRPIHANLLAVICNLASGPDWARTSDPALIKRML